MKLKLTSITLLLIYSFTVFSHIDIRYIIPKEEHEIVKQQVEYQYSEKDLSENFNRLKSINDQSSLVYRDFYLIEKSID